MSVDEVDVGDEGVAELVALLTAELAASGYADDEMFGYSLEQLAAGGVRLIGARAGNELIGIGGVEIDGTVAELKRFFVAPAHRGRGVADEILAALLDLARDAGVATVRLETGTQQHAAMAFYHRNGFRDIPRFGPYVNSASSICMERTI